MGLGSTTTILFEDAEGNLVPVSVANPIPSTGSGGGGGDHPIMWGSNGNVRIDDWNLRQGVSF